MKKIRIPITIAALLTVPVIQAAAETKAEDFPLNTHLVNEAEGEYYVPSSFENILWGHLPNRSSEPILTIPSGGTVTFDTVSHEGLMEDQGRNPVEYFGQHGIKPDEVLEDAKSITASALEHDFEDDGPHIVTGPVAIEGADPGDVLKIEVLSLAPRVPYGVISNRHGKGALPDEFPENDGPEEGASAENPDLYHNVSTFTPIKKIEEEWYAEILGEDVLFPINPFMGLMGVASDTDEFVHSVPPSETGGNLDINELGVGSTLYLPIKVTGGLFYTGDPHFSQGDGEVALTALEASLRGTFRLTVLEKGEETIPGDNEKFIQPFGETEDYWIPIGLDEDLDEAMKEAVRESVDFLDEELKMDRAKALAYLSAATDYEVSQVVDKTKGVHGLINKTHFNEKLAAAEGESAVQGEELPDTATNGPTLALVGAAVVIVGGILLFTRRRRLN